MIIMNHSLSLVLLVACALFSTKQVQALQSVLVKGRVQSSSIPSSDPSTRHTALLLRSTVQGTSPRSTHDAVNYSWSDELAVEWDWKKLADDVFREDKRPVVLFDGVCNLCNSGVNFAMDHDGEAKLRFCSLQSRAAQSLLLREGKSPDHKQIAFITESEGYFSSHAVSHICTKLDSRPLQWLGVLGQYTPAWIRESVYQVVSRNRYNFGEADQCRLDFDGTYTSRFVSDPLDEEVHVNHTM